MSDDLKKRVLAIVNAGPNATDSPDDINDLLSRLQSLPAKELERRFQLVSTILKESYDDKKRRPEGITTWLYRYIFELLPVETDSSAVLRLADAVLQKEIGDKPPSEWVLRQARAFSRHLKAFMSDALGLDDEGQGEVSEQAFVSRHEDAEDGMWWLTARLAAYLERMGDQAAKDERTDLAAVLMGIAYDVRETNREKWSRRDDEPLTPWRWWFGGEHVSNALTLLGRYVWRLELAEQWESHQRNRKYATLPAAVVNSFVGMRGSSVEGDESGFTLRNKSGSAGSIDVDQARASYEKALPAKAATITDHTTSALVEALHSSIEESIKAIFTATGQKLFFYLVHRGKDQFNRFTMARAFGAPTFDAFDFRRISIVGGIDELGRMVGSRSGTDAAILKNALNGLELIRLPVHGFPEGHIKLLGWSWDRPSGGSEGDGERSVVKITLEDPMLPDFTNELSKASRKHRQGRILVPVPQPSVLPKAVGHRQYSGNQHMAVLLMMRELSERSIELVESGGIFMPRRRWAELIDQAGMKDKYVEKIQGSWVHPTGELFPLLERVGPDKYTLSSAHKDSLELILDGGKRRIAGEEGQKRRKSTKDKALFDTKAKPK